MNEFRAVPVSDSERKRLTRRTVLTRIAGGGALATVAGLGTSSAGAVADPPAIGPRRGARLAQSDASPAAGATAAESGYASVNGLEMYYEIHGSGGVPLLLLHGGLITIDLSWAMLLPILAESRQVIAVELQGHGHTADIDRPLSFEQMADDTAALLQEIGIDEADVFGFSTGGSVALQLAIRHPEQVRKLVVASAPFRNDGWYPEILEAMGAMTGDVMVGTPLHDAYVNVAPNPDDWVTLVAKMGELQAGPDSAYDWSAEVAEIQAPTMLIYGDADSVLPEHAVEFFRLLGGGVPGDLTGLPTARLAVIPGTAHSSLLFRAQYLLPIVTTFLDAPMPEGE